MSLLESDKDIFTSTMFNEYLQLQKNLFLTIGISRGQCGHQEQRNICQNMLTRLASLNFEIFKCNPQISTILGTFLGRVVRLFASYKRKKESFLHNLACVFALPLQPFSNLVQLDSSIINYIFSSRSFTIFCHTLSDCYLEDERLQPIKVSLEVHNS